jgi:hypothetical protein
MSTMFDSARTLDAGEVELMGGASVCGGMLSRLEDTEDWGLRSLNAGGAVQVGVADRLTLRGRYEQINLRDRAESTGGPVLPADTRINYLEFAMKWGIVKDKSGLSAALLFPIGYYVHEETNILTIAPAGLVTYQMSDNWDVTFQGKFHFLSGEESRSMDLTGGVGLGFSTDFNRWAVRPEIATNFFNITLGVGFTAVLNPK